MLILIGTLLGVIVSGVLAMFAQHFQAQRDDLRQQRAYEKGVRSEGLNRVKHLIDIGTSLTAYLDVGSVEGAFPEAGINEIHQYSAALNGALVSSIAMEAPELKSELLTNSSLTARVGNLVNTHRPFDRTLFGEMIDNLARIEHQYTELKLTQTALLGRIIPNSSSTS